LGSSPSPSAAAWLLKKLALAWLSYLRSIWLLLSSNCNRICS
jgi:hypothetical protein